VCNGIALAPAITGQALVTIPVGSLSFTSAMSSWNRSTHLSQMKTAGPGRRYLAFLPRPIAEAAPDPDGVPKFVEVKRWSPA
jgi:hypothetical protein